MLYRMSESGSLLHARWFVVILLLTLVPLFPEYISFPLTLAAFFLSLRLRPTRSLRQQLGRIGGLIALYILYMGLSTLYSSDPLYSLLTTAMWLALGLGYLALTNVLISRDRIRTFCRLVTLVAGILGLLALLQAVLYHVFHLDIPPRFWDFLDLDVYRLLPLRLELMRGQHRSAATFNNPNLFCEYLSMVMPVVLYTMIQEINQESRYVRWFIAAALLAMAGVLFSMSRGGYIALLTVLLIFLASKPQRVLEIGAILLLVSLFLPSSVTNELVAFSSAHGDMTERAKAWEICLQAILERPIFGYGAGCGSVQQILAAQGLNIPHAHNLILEVLTEGGLVAFALLTAIEWHILRGGFRLLSSPYAHWLGVVCIAFISAFFVHGLVDYPLLTPKVVHTFLMMVGLFASSYRLYFPSPAPDQTRSLPTDGIGITASR